MRTARKPAGVSGGARLEVFHHLFASVAEEMGANLRRSAFSPNIKERRDFSCALFDARGRMLSQAAHIPIHLGSAPACVQAVMAWGPLEPGDAVLLNDPFQGGTHLPDVTLVTPIFCGRRKRPDFYCANRAHHADVGGASPGSMAPAADVHGEGLRIPPTRLVRRGRVQREVLDLCLANMRVPREREGDLLAQWSANRLAERRFGELFREHGRAELLRRSRELLDWTAGLAEELVLSLPDGDYSASDEVAWAGGRAARIRLVLSVRGRRATFDLRATDDQVGAPFNTPRAVVVSAVFYVLRLLLPRDTPTNDGLLAPVRVRTRPTSLVDARYPAPVCAGNVETSQRLVDVLLGALAEALPRRVPAASAGTMSNLTFGGARPDGSRFTYYETIAGGAGGSAQGPGASAVHTHMTNTRNTPIEAFESQLPVRVLACGVRRGSGGAGRQRGGDGTHKHFLFLAPAQLSWLADRERRGPPGRAGGKAGRPGALRVRRACSDRARRLPSPASTELPAGAEVRVDTPGGGGFGRPA